MQFSAEDLSRFCSQSWHYCTGSALCAFGVADFAHAACLKSSLKIVFIARGILFLTAGCLSLVSQASRIPFIAAHIISVGLNGHKLYEDNSLRSEISSTLGIISSIAYVTFSFYAHPVTFSIAFLTGSIKIIMHLT